MDLYWGWPVATTVLMFVTYWVSKVQGFADGYDEGRSEGIEQGAKMTAKVVMQYMRDKYEISMSDVEIQDVVDGINISEDHSE